MSQFSVRDWIEPIPQDMLSNEDPKKRPGWKARAVTADGKEVTDIVLFEAESDKGTLRHGKHVGKSWDQWAFEEAGGGGSVILPYVELTFGYYVGGVIQHRPNMGGHVLCAIGGFLKPDTTHFQTAVEEGEEESGLSMADRMYELPGQPGNSNRAFFVTDDDRGIRYYGLELRNDWVELREDSGATIRPDVLRPISDEAKRIVGTQLVPMSLAVKSPDLILCAGVARLAACLGLL